MIEEIKELAELNRKIEEEYNFISVKMPFSGGDINVHVSDLYTLLGIANGEELCASFHDETYPYKLSFYEEEIQFFTLLDQEGYQEYKKATAPTVTKEK